MMSSDVFAVSPCPLEYQSVLSSKDLFIWFGTQEGQIGSIWPYGFLSEVLKSF